VLLEALRLGDAYEVAGLLDPRGELHGQRLLDVPVLGDDDLLGDLARRGIGHFFLGVGSTTGAHSREELFAKPQRYGLAPINVIHPGAIVSPSARVGRGAAILAGAVIGTQAQLGENVIVNTGAIVEHDCVIGDHAHIATGACLAGDVVVGRGSHVGVGASVRQGIRIGVGATIGAGAAVVRDVPDEVVVAGVPARILKSEVP
jgi:UDP-perosamine 4-acetyltransferase